MPGLFSAAAFANAKKELGKVISACEGVEIDISMLTASEKTRIKRDFTGWIVAKLKFAYD